MSTPAAATSANPDPAHDRPARSVAVIGTGVIGTSWITHYLASGLDVTAYDPSPDAEARTRAAVDVQWASLDPQRRAAGASLDRLHFASSIGSAGATADFVQENGPEREDLKAELMARLDEAVPADVVIASSSSGLTASAIAAHCPAHPERVLIGHPFNPPHLIPLVEVVPGRHTSPRAVDQALSFYREAGKRPILLRQELPGHVANRLQAALWREAYALVGRGVVSVADIDTAISQGPGLRWAVLGPFLNQHFSGGTGGIAHTLAHLGPPMEAWWDDLGHPTLTPELVAAVVAGVDDELAGQDADDLLRRRDEVLWSLLEAKTQAGLA